MLEFKGTSTIHLTAPNHLMRKSKIRILLFRDLLSNLIVLVLINCYE